MEIRRSGARPGDIVWVSGTIGDAFLGLGVLRGAYPELAAEHRGALIARFRLPEPRADLGPALCGIAHAMIDVSDGLLADLGHICETSGVAAIVELAPLPLSAAARAAVGARTGHCSAARRRRRRLRIAVHRTRRSDRGDRRASDRGSASAISAIGRIEAGAGVRLVDGDGHEVAVEAAGYRHF